MKKHNKIIAIQGDPIQSINRKTDTTLLLALEAQRRGYKIYYYETKNLTYSNKIVYALSKEVKLAWYTVSQPDGLILYCSFQVKKMPPWALEQVVFAPLMR